MASRGISKEELQNMLERYHIGKKPLAALLGWGETTILLYMEMDELPENEYTRKLLRLYAHPEEYAALLQERGSSLTGVALRRTVEAVRNLCPNGGILECAGYVMELLDKSTVSEKKEMSLVRLEAILFYSQIVSLVLADAELFPDCCQLGKLHLPYDAPVERAMDYGLEVAFDKKRFCGTELASSLSTLQKEIIETIYGIFEWHGARAIEELLEAERVMLIGPSATHRRRAISNDMLKRIYGDVFLQAKVHKIKDIEIFIQKRINYIKNKR